MINKPREKIIKTERKAWTLLQIAKRFKITFFQTRQLIHELQGAGVLSVDADRYNRYTVL